MTKDVDTPTEELILLGHQAVRELTQRPQDPFLIQLTPQGVGAWSVRFALGSGYEDLDADALLEQVVEDDQSFQEGRPSRSTSWKVSRAGRSSMASLPPALSSMAFRQIGSRASCCHLAGVVLGGIQVADGVRREVGHGEGAGAEVGVDDCPFSRTWSAPLERAALHGDGQGLSTILPWVCRRSSSV